MLKVYKYSIIYAIGGACYGALEIAFRGRTHWSMVLAGGLCLTIIYAISVNSRMAFWQKCLTGGTVITAVEFITGLIVNVGLGMNVWSYAGMPMNIMGQICPLFSILWCLLCIPVVGLCKYFGRVMMR